MRLEPVSPRVPTARLFGRKAIACPRPQQQGWVDDLKLFAATFTAGFLFMTVFLA